MAAWCATERECLWSGSVHLTCIIIQEVLNEAVRSVFNAAAKTKLLKISRARPGREGDRNQTVRVTDFQKASRAAAEKTPATQRGETTTERSE